MNRILTLFALVLFTIGGATACEEEGRQARGTDPGTGTVDTNQNQSGCSTQSDDEFCTAAGFECGLHTFVDECGDTREANCGASAEVCGEFETCGGAGNEGRCGCTPESHEELCSAAEYECGPLTVSDSCGTEREVQTCGDETEVCGELETCGGAGEEGQCGCTPTTCEAEGILCGYIEDGCGGEPLYCDAFCAEQVSVGEEFACAVGSGRIKCWGRNSNGQLGNSTTSNAPNPVDVTGILNAVEVAAGTNHSCAVVYNPDEETRQIRCWGINSNGQLGNGDSVNLTEPAVTPAVYAGAVKVALGARHTCALVEAGYDFEYLDGDGQLQTRPAQTMSCWGHNSHGQIGDALLDIGATVTLARPVDLEDNYNVVDIALGSHHSCALMQGPFDFAAPVAEENLESIVKCWGRNRFGQVASLSDNFAFDAAFATNVQISPLDAATLIRTPTELSYDDYFTGTPSPRWISAGEDYTCILDDNNEDVFCWGAFHAAPRPGVPCTVGVYMYKAPRGSSGTATLELEFDNPDLCTVLPTDDIDLFPVIEYGVSSNGDHNLIKAHIDAVAARPYHFHLSDSPHISTPAAMQMQTLQISAGSNHFCAIIDLPTYHNSNIFCLGANRSGQLGEGTDNSWTKAQEVSRDIDDQVVMATQLSLGKNLSCGLMDDNNVRCWGSNEYGQIGNSDLQEDESFRPFDVRLQVAGD